jgi:NitT/TauT family transport system ATP-binding protein
MSVQTQIIAHNLAKQFDQSGNTVVAYEHLDFSVDYGEFVCIVGPSGCGKTTLLRTLAGLERATEGTLQVNSTHGTETLQIGMVFQEHGLFPWMRIADNIRFPLENNARLKGQDVAAICQRYLQHIGMEKFARFFPHQVSGGMRQRVSLARSFAVDPDILLMDEPFVFLDYQTRQVLHQLVLDIWSDSGKTVVFVTHDIEEAVYLADRVLVMSAHPGQIIQTFDIEFDRPRNPQSIRQDPRYFDYVNRISMLIQTGMSATAEPAG